MSAIVRLLFCSLFLMSINVAAKEMPLETYEQGPKGDVDELNPFDPNIEQQLEEFDKVYEEETGQSAFLEESEDAHYNDGRKASCKKDKCKIWAEISKAHQQLNLYEDGVLIYTWDVSTGAAGHGTPNFDRHPNGRIYDQYSSSKYPGGDYNGLGNMPYAVFIEGGFAIHGTPEGNWPYLGQKASHGCIRLHPDNAFIFNRLVRENGINNVWITVK